MGHIITIAVLKKMNRLVDLIMKFGFDISTKAYIKKGNSKDRKKAFGQDNFN